MIKRPNIDTIYFPVKRSPDDVAADLTFVLMTGFAKTYLKTYFCEMRYDDDSNSFEPVNEEMGLNGLTDLRDRVKRLGCGRWALNVNLGFAPAEVYPGVFVDPRGSEETSVLITTDPGMTSFLEDFKEAHPLYALFLVRLACAVGSDMFLAALEQDYWRRLTREQFLDRDAWPHGTYVVGWRTGVFKRHDLAARWRLPLERIAGTTLGFEFATFIPEP